MATMDTDTLEDTHMELHRSEVAALEPSDWERWIDRVEALIGHSADGDQREDGYSLDGFFSLWEQGRTPAEAAKEVDSIEL